jgi:resolvase-like protein
MTAINADLSRANFGVQQLALRTGFAIAEFESVERAPLCEPMLLRACSQFSRRPQHRSVARDDDREREDVEPDLGSPGRSVPVGSFRGWAHYVRAYLRASTDDRDATRARDQLKALADERGLQIVSWYVENESGAKLARPELFMLLADAHEGDILLVEQVDRLSRLSSADWERLKADLAVRKFRVCFWTCWPQPHARITTIAGAGSRRRGKPKPRQKAATRAVLRTPNAMRASAA